MREWRDVHHQLERVLKSLKMMPSGKDNAPRGLGRKTGVTEPSTQPAKANAPGSDERGHKPKQHPTSKQQATSNTPHSTPVTPHSSLGSEAATYAAIHRSILTGLLSNIAVKEEEHNYRGPRNRKALLFPGSGLFDHATAKKQRKASYAKTSKPKPAKTTAPAWIVCGEWMETSRLFARTAAKVQVQWIEDVAGDLLKLKHPEPFWSTKSAAALCKQRKMLFGLRPRAVWELVRRG